MLSKFIQVFVTSLKLKNYAVVKQKLKLDITYNFKRKM